jgi:hypothetical protein
LNNAGITRIIITDRVSGAGAARFEESRPLQPTANQLYRDIFTHAGLALLPGDEEVLTSGEEFSAGYDKQLGIDIFLRFESGMQATLQEKFLKTGDRFTTVTVEYYQNWRTQEPGDWFKMRCDYYFVGYHQRGIQQFDKWILLDWPAIQRATAQGRIPWQEMPNMRDNARANFKYTAFDDIPDECVMARQPERMRQQAMDTLRTIAAHQPARHPIAPATTDTNTIIDDNGWVYTRDSFGDWRGFNRTRGLRTRFKRTLDAARQDAESGRLQRRLADGSWRDVNDRHDR